MDTNETTVDQEVLRADAASAATPCPLSSRRPQSGGSHKSIKCMPCCKRYIGNAFSSFHTLTGQIAPRHDLAEMSGSSELCKGLADSIEVPTLSEQHRQLVREVTAVLRRQTPMRLTYS
uniref:Uncharacterized protein n=1 Tax=Setaria viridis TaxID=4556 RepID=A0A4U6WHD8_SETVI|nr:uncharacterized protein LOC117847442 isoform X4 [Setaria viridis]TKW41534.1 hypothetical protein SEVIR_1G322600v2 [Setaria viridis]